MADQLRDITQELDSIEGHLWKALIYDDETGSDEGPSSLGRIVTQLTRIADALETISACQVSR